MTERRIDIICATATEASEGDRIETVFALCDDGRVFRLFIRDGACNNWQSLPPIPQNMKNIAKGGE